jgi:ferredoxin-thioredoxin reductase catalytic subunit
MSNKKEISQKEIESIFEKLNEEAQASGYHLNPDTDFTKELVEGLLTNEKRYGYWACPCRLASGNKEKDLDIICPCDYRDLDLNDYNTCYCGLYVSQKVVDGKIKIAKIPERRPSEEKREKTKIQMIEKSTHRSFPVWRCRVCGYLCARKEPPEVCPICKAKKERFDKFM